MYSDTGNTTSLVLGFPIRTSSDPRSVDSSPRHIAASHVLHRLPVPRHPPCALKHLQHKNQKMSFKRNCTSTHKHHACMSDARNHYPQIKHHTPPPKEGATTKSYPRFPTTGQRDSGPVASKPNSVSDDFAPAVSPAGTQCLSRTRPPPTTGEGHPTNRPAHRTPTHCGRDQVSWCSLERR